MVAVFPPSGRNGEGDASPSPIFQPMNTAGQREGPQRA
jgi:hypothetical protein